MGDIRGMLMVTVECICRLTDFKTTSVIHQCDRRSQLGKVTIVYLDWIKVIGVSQSTQGTNHQTVTDVGHLGTITTPLCLFRTPVTDVSQQRYCTTLNLSSTPVTNVSYLRKVTILNKLCTKFDMTTLSASGTKLLYLIWGITSSSSCPS